MKSFAYAARGIFDTFLTERNMRIHTAAAFYVIISGIITHITAVEWFAVLLCIGVVAAAELMNTALEAACDAAHPEPSPLVKKAKDATAGAVLLCAAVSAIVGGAVFFKAERVRAMLDFLKGNIFAVPLLAVTAVFWVYIIFIWRRKNDR